MTPGSLAARGVLLIEMVIQLFLLNMIIQLLLAKVLL